MSALDDLELELRKLPGVKAAGFDEQDDVMLVQVHVGDQVDAPALPVPFNASRLVARHIDQRSAVEIVRWRQMPGSASTAAVAPPEMEVRPPAPSLVDVTAEETPEPRTGEPETEGHRPRLLAVLAFPDTDELEVHLILDGRRTIGRATTSAGLVSAVQATVEAVRELGAPFDPRPLWARVLDQDEDDERVVVAVALDGVVEDAHIDYGLAAGTSPTDAAARSTLDALNRRLARVL